MEKEKRGKQITAALIAAALIVVVALCLVVHKAGGAAPDPTETTGAIATTEGSESTTESTEATGEPAEEPTTELAETIGETTEEPTEKTAETTEPATQPAHVHSYTKTTVKPTCTKGGCTVNTCDCGYSYKSDETEATGHDYRKTVVSSTTQAQGYTLYTCQTCGDSYKSDFTDKLPEETKPTEPKPTEPKPTEPKPTEPKSTEPKPTEPKPTEPKPTEPKPTEPAATEPKPTEPTKPAECQHEYNTIVAGASCVEGARFIYSCKLCGHSYMEYFSEKDPNAHKYTVTASSEGDCTTGKDGSVTYVCSVCGDSYTETTGGHKWVHHHEDEVGHDEWYMVCHCGGWSMTVSSDWESSYSVHLRSVEKPSEHSYYEMRTWVVDTPAQDYDECSVCGARK